ncbi:BON domain-containing protein [Alcaligenes sp. AB3]|uniref:BON domain-containing protein n=1 Tax=Alcaligenes sp. AB3 TaxID=2962569 RepID=UPI0028820903|nr:BON domain-containing protein [Alcaligenes sp. AB3]MDT0217293.1 BON domain-containing protein [Alcaligenes sp. AB3]
MTNSTTISKLLAASALSFGLSAGALAEDRPSHPDLSATAGKGAAEEKTPGEANAKEVHNRGADAHENAPDAEITKQVKAHLAAQKGLQSNSISVETKNGVITLTGKVSDDKQLKQAISEVESIKGVSKVDAAGLTVKAN